MQSVGDLSQNAFDWISATLLSEVESVREHPWSPRSFAIYSASAVGFLSGLFYLAFLKHHRDSHLTSARIQFEKFEAEHDGLIDYIRPPKPGCGTHFDYTDVSNKPIDKKHHSQQGLLASDIHDKIKVRKDESELRVVCWNIERGYKLSSIIAELKQLNADVILLQECDIGCDRSGNRNVICEIAYALRMRGVFAAEAWNVNDNHENLGPQKTKHHERKDDNNNNNTNDDSDAHGCEGNAIITRLPILEWSVLNLPCVRNSHMPDHRDQKKHAVCVVHVKSDDDFGDVICYSAHFDAFAGRVRRAKEQYEYLYDHAQKEYFRDESGQTSVIIGGDFNTHNHGIARLWAPYSGDCPMRFGYLGYSEAEWWESFVIGKEKNHRMQVSDPFDAARDWTVQIYKYGIPAFWGKLDWMVYSTDRLKCTQHWVNQDTLASDHQYLLCDFVAT